MLSDQLIYGLEYQARALVAQVSDTENTNFFIGTQTFPITNNELHLVTVDEGCKELSKKIYKHGCGEIWSLDAPKFESNVLVSCYNTVADNDDCCVKSTIWMLPSDEDSDLKVSQHIDVSPYGSDIKVAKFNQSESRLVALVVDNKVVVCDVGNGSDEVSTVITLQGKGAPKFSSGKWNPLLHYQFATLNECNIHAWDTRVTTKQSWSIENAHGQLIRDIDFNPNRHNIIGSCGDDGCANFWDVRQLSSGPLASRSDHSHWVWCLRFNRYRDELVATSGSDDKVYLARMPSVSAATNDDGDSRDGLVAVLHDHQHSVYSVAWSAANPMILASLSYDGRFLVNRIPKNYRILPSS